MLTACPTAHDSAEKNFKSLFGSRRGRSQEGRIDGVYELIGEDDEAFAWHLTAYVSYMSPHGLEVTGPKETQIEFHQQEEGIPGYGGPIGATTLDWLQKVVYSRSGTKLSTGGIVPNGALLQLLALLGIEAKWLGSEVIPPMTRFSPDAVIDLLAMPRTSGAK